MRISDWSSDVCSSDLIWAARRDTVRRAAQAVLEAAEAIQATGASRRLLEVRGSFDEFNLDIELLHDGPPLKLQSGPGKSAATLLDLDDHAFEAALDDTLAGVSHALLKRLADRLSTGRDRKSTRLNSS